MVAAEPALGYSMCMRYLKWQVIARSNTRACSYAKRDMIAALERAGCHVVEGTDPLFDRAPPVLARKILTATRYLEEHEDPKEVREDVTRAIRTCHPRAGKKFLGLFEE